MAINTNNGVETVKRSVQTQRMRRERDGKIMRAKREHNAKNKKQEKVNKQRRMTERWTQNM